MKIRIEMTSEELSKGMELVAAILPGADVSQYMPTERQQTEIRCNAYEMNNIADPETGITTELEIKTHFIAWVLRKMKPFIAAIMSLWHMITDFYEDMELMMGEVTVLTNGEDLAEKLSKMAEESMEDNEDGYDGFENQYHLQEMNRCVYRVYTSDPKHYNAVNRIFDKREDALKYMKDTEKYNTKFIFFDVPADFDFDKPSNALINYKDHLIRVFTDGSAEDTTINTRFERFIDALTSIDIADWRSE